jgi:hypothetical protein
MLLRAFAAAALAASVMFAARAEALHRAPPGHSPTNCRLPNGAVTRVARAAACIELGGTPCTNCQVGAPPTTHPHPALINCRLPNGRVTQVSRAAACAEIGGTPCSACVAGTRHRRHRRWR